MYVGNIFLIFTEVPTYIGIGIVCMSRMHDRGYFQLPIFLFI